MNCPKCKNEMEFEDGLHHWNERTYYCAECDIEEYEDITGEKIDAAKHLLEGSNHGSK